MVDIPILNLTWLVFLSHMASVPISHGWCSYPKSHIVGIPILNLTWLVFLSHMVDILILNSHG